MRIAVLGTGNMGRALIRGLSKAYGDKVRISAYDKSPDALKSLGEDVEVIAPQSWKEAQFIPDVVIVSVKPADMGTVLETISPVAREFSFLTVSVAAGIPLSFLKAKLGPSTRLCRVMPNTPALVGEGMSAYALTENCSDQDRQRVEYIFNACGSVIQVPETQINAVTGLSGSGPAFVYSFIEALAEGGVSAGLPYKTALKAAVQTVTGAARMVQSTQEHPSVLKSKVMSPGGTTARGLLALEKHAFRHAVQQAVIDAANRSAQLGS
ncbi:MAG: pyrroline-5-carboxylate reductase [Chitinispirillaceae bacterium]